MYYIANGVGWKWLGTLFAIFASVAAFGIGNMVQPNSVGDAVQATFNVPLYVTGIVLMVFTAAVILGGIKNIGRVTGLLVPIMIGFYMLGVLIIDIAESPGAPARIVSEAFTPTAATGGFLGSTVMMTIRMGVVRGVFSNESGLGRAPIAAAAAQTKHPVTQALVFMTQTFIDTLVVCTMTGLVLIITGTWNSGETGASLTTTAFQAGFTGGKYVVTIGLVLFAYSIILGWRYYEEKSIGYLFGERVIMPYRIIFVLFVGIGAVAKLDLVWSLSDVFNGMVAIPNLIGLLILSPVIVKESRDYFEARRSRAR